MIPIGDRNPTRSFPIVNIALIVINVLVFVYELSLGGRDLDEFLQRWGVAPFTVSRDPLSPEELQTVYTSMFLHAGWLHLLGNMVFLWVFGDNVEDALGHLRYLLFYLVAGTGAVAAQVSMASDTLVPLVGASGAISGVLGAYILLYPRSAVLVLIPLFFIPWTAEVPALFVIGFWFLLQLMSGLAAVGHAIGGAGGVAWWAHVGGFLSGMLLLAILRPAALTRPRSGLR